MNWFRLGAGMLVLWAVSATPVAATNITAVSVIDAVTSPVVHTQWTGQTWTAVSAGRPYSTSSVGDLLTVPYFTPSGSGSSQPYDPPAYVNRNHTYADGGTFTFLPGPTTVTYPAMPAYLKGGEYLQQVQDNRTLAGLDIAVTIANASTAYLLIDNRLVDNNQFNPPTFDATHMAWVAANGWLPKITGTNHLGNGDPDEVAIDEGQDNTDVQGGGTGAGTVDNFYSVYYQDFPAGTFHTFDQNFAKNMYGVVVVAVPEPATAMMLLLAAPVGAAFLRRRKR